MHFVSGSHSISFNVESHDRFIYIPARKRHRQPWITDRTKIIWLNLRECHFACQSWWISNFLSHWNIEIEHFVLVNKQKSQHLQNILNEMSEFCIQTQKYIDDDESTGTACFHYMGIYILEYDKIHRWHAYTTNGNITLNSINAVHLKLHVSEMPDSRHLDGTCSMDVMNMNIRHRHGCCWAAMTWPWPSGWPAGRSPLGTANIAGDESSFANITDEMSIVTQCAR